MGLINWTKDKLGLSPLPNFQVQNARAVRRKCSFLDLQEFLQVLMEGREAFLVLEPEHPFRNIRFLQAAIVEGAVELEASVWRDGEWVLMGSSYPFQDRQEVERIFEDFFLKGRISLEHFHTV